MIELPALAKVNLSLEVTGRREDGFHELVSIMQTVSLADTLVLRRSDELSFACSDTSLAKGNLVERAARLLRDFCGVSRGCSIELHKEIPVAAGLGGGSSDAASTLIGLNRFWNLRLSCADILGLAAKLGSDVPFFLWGGACLVSGHGENVTPLPAPDPTWYLLVNPRLGVSTERVFAELHSTEWTDGERTRAIAIAGPPYSIGHNGLRDALFRVYPAARDCFLAVDSVVPEGAIISGSGPTIIARFQSEEDTRRAAGRLANRGYRIDVTASMTGRADESPCA